MKRRRVVLAAGLGLCASLVVGASADGCVLPGFTLADSAVGGGSADSTTRASSSSTHAQSSSTTSGTGGSVPDCALAHPPPPPGVPHEMAAHPSYVVAMHSIDFGLAGTTPGYDLDSTCTCTDDAGSTCIPAAATVCDDPNGVDNSFRALLQRVEAIDPIIDNPGINANCDAGAWSVLMRIDDYDGKPDDLDVKVSFFPSSGFEGAGGGPATPKWDGTDRWKITGSALVNGGGGGGGAGGGGGGLESIYTSPGAYVAGGVLVASFPSLSLTIAGAQESVTVSLVGGFVTGTLVKDDAGAGYHVVDGVIAGRWPTASFFETLSSFRDQNGMPICTDNQIYPLVHSEVCGSADILSTIGSTGVPCDAISVGVGFTADPAEIGSVQPPGTPMPNCPAATDPAMDSCL
jgi:hypothetical protein